MTTDRVSVITINLDVPSLSDILDQWQNLNQQIQTTQGYAQNATDALQGINAGALADLNGDITAADTAVVQLTTDAQAAGEAIQTVGTGGAEGLQETTAAATDTDTAVAALLEQLTGMTGAFAAATDQANAMAEAMQQSAEAVQHHSESSGQASASSGVLTNALTEMGVPAGELVEHFSQMSEGVTKLGGDATEAAGGMDLLAAGVGALALGAVAESTAAFVELDDKIREFSEMTGISEGTSQRLMLAQQELTGSSDLASRAFVMMSTNTQTLADALDKGTAPTSKFAQGLENLGINLRSFVALSPEGRINAIGQAFEALGPTIDKTATAADLFGARIGPQLIPLLDNFSSQMAHAGSVIDQSGASIVGSDEKVVQFHTSVADLSTAMTGLEVAIGTNVLPVLTGLATGVTNVVNAFHSVAGPVEEAIGAIGGFLDKARDIALVIPGIPSWIAQASLAWDHLGTSAAASTPPVTESGTAMAATADQAQALSAKTDPTAAFYGTVKDKSSAMAAGLIADSGTIDTATGQSLASIKKMVDGSVAAVDDMHQTTNTTLDAMGLDMVAKMDQAGTSGTAAMADSIVAGTPSVVAASFNMAAAGAAAAHQEGAYNAAGASDLAAFRAGLAGGLLGGPVSSFSSPTAPQDVISGFGGGTDSGSLFTDVAAAIAAEQEDPGGYNALSAAEIAKGAKKGGGGGGGKGGGGGAGTAAKQEATDTTGLATATKDAAAAQQALNDLQSVGAEHYMTVTQEQSTAAHALADVKKGLYQDALNAEIAADQQVAADYASNDQGRITEDAAVAKAAQTNAASLKSGYDDAFKAASADAAALIKQITEPTAIHVKLQTEQVSAVSDMMTAVGLDPSKITLTGDALKALGANVQQLQGQMIAGSAQVSAAWGQLNSVMADPAATDQMKAEAQARLETATNALSGIKAQYDQENQAFTAAQKNNTDTALQSAQDQVTAERDKGNQEIQLANSVSKGKLTEQQKQTEAQKVADGEQQISAANASQAILDKWKADDAQIAIDNGETWAWVQKAIYDAMHGATEEVIQGDLAQAKASQDLADGLSHDIYDVEIPALKALQQQQQLVQGASQGAATAVASVGTALASGPGGGGGGGAGGGPLGPASGGSIGGHAPWSGDRYTNQGGVLSYPTGNAPLYADSGGESPSDLFNAWLKKGIAALVGLGGAYSASVGSTRLQVP